MLLSSEEISTSVFRINQAGSFFQAARLQRVILPVPLDLQGSSQPPALLQGLPGCVVTVDEIQRPHGCFQALVR